MGSCQDREVFKFYKDLMSVERVDKCSIQKANFLIKPINETDKNKEINYKINYVEAQDVVMKMKNSSPGPNGLIIGFYQEYFKYFGHYFIDLLNNHSDKLSNTFIESRIKLIQKNKNNIKSINDLRTIFFTNIDYRILTEILANRFRLISLRIIEDHQTCSIKDRRMNVNIWLLRDLIDDSIRKNKDLILISVDQMKAFDSINHNYLFGLLENLNIGDFMLNNIKRPYETSYAKIVLNKLESGQLIIKSGIKQRCALSMILYIIAIEELLLRLENSKNIKGNKLSILGEKEVKSTAYADDIIGYVSDELSIELFFQEFDEWGEISGASINK